MSKTKNNIINVVIDHDKALVNTAFTLQSQQVQQKVALKETIAATTGNKQTAILLFHTRTNYVS